MTKTYRAELELVRKKLNKKKNQNQNQNKEIEHKLNIFCLVLGHDITKSNKTELN